VDLFLLFHIFEQAKHWDVERLRINDGVRPRKNGGRRQCKTDLGTVNAYEKQHSYEYKYVSNLSCNVCDWSGCDFGHSMYARIPRPSRFRLLLDGTWWCKDVFVSLAKKWTLGSRVRRKRHEHTETRRELLKSPFHGSSGS
jgi:hypothetical protein